MSPPKLVSRPQIATTTGPGTPKRRSIVASGPAYRLSSALPRDTMPGVTWLASKPAKLCPNILTPPSCRLTSGLYETPPSAASTAVCDTPSPTATFLKEASQSPKPSALRPQSSARAGAPPTRPPRRRRPRLQISPLSQGDEHTRAAGVQRGAGGVFHIPGTCLTSMISTQAPGIMRCGWSLPNSFVAASADFGLHDPIASDLVLRVGSSLRVDPLGLPQRRAAIDQRRLVVAHPFHPRLHPLLLLLGVEVFIIFSNSAPLAMYRTRNLVIGPSSC